MDSEQSNGYLRQGEFRRWADGVDRCLGDLQRSVNAHAEMLAVVRDQREQSIYRRNSITAFVSAFIATLISVLLGYFTH